MACPPVLAVCGLAFEAAIAAGPGVVTVCGPGPARLQARLDALLGASPPEDGRGWAGIISFGCAGALNPGLPAGTCVVATGVLTRDGLVPADSAWMHALLGCLPRAWPARLAGLDDPLLASADKVRLWRDSGACAADMESHAAALAASRHGLPFAACRVVLDPAWRDVPASALAGMREDGSSAILPVLRALGAAPRELAGLCALAVEAHRARRVLRQVRARLGPRLAAPPR